MKFQISDDIFWGYNNDIDINLFKDSEDILQVVICNLEIELENLGLEILIEKLKSKKFHIPKFEKIINSDNTIYICSHCHEGCNCIS